MAVEIKQEKINVEPQVINGLETSPKIESFGNIPQVESNQNVGIPQSIDPNKEQADRALSKAVQEGKVGYDSPEVKRRIESNLFPENAESWYSLINSKQQGFSPNN
jgi:hypothetical protein